jgi:hypothetical protein
MSNYIDIDDMHLMERTRCDAADQNWDSILLLWKLE